jgi:hypothetical protein
MGWLDLDRFAPGDMAVRGPQRRELLTYLSLACMHYH